MTSHLEPRRLTDGSSCRRPAQSRFGTPGGRAFRDWLNDMYMQTYHMYMQTYYLHVYIYIYIHIYVCDHSYMMLYVYNTYIYLVGGGLKPSFPSK